MRHALSGTLHFVCLFQEQTNSLEMWPRGSRRAVKLSAAWK